MAEPVLVDDPDDPRLADFVALNDVRRRERIEARSGVLVVEGTLAIRRLLATGRPVRALALSEAKWRSLADELGPIAVTVLVVPRSVMERVAGFDVHRGALASADRWSLPGLGAVLAAASTVAALEGLNDAENIGSIFRTAAALGIDAVVLDAQCADPLSRRSVRVSMGEALSLPFTRLAEGERLVEVLRAGGYRTIALTPDPDATPIEQVSRRPGERLALLLGAERPGLTADTMVGADERVRIPIAGVVDSLNVSHAAAIAFHRLAP